MGHNYIGHNCIGHNYTGHNYIGHKYTGHKYLGHNYIGHNCTGHNETGNSYTGHNYIGHNCIGGALIDATPDQTGTVAGHAYYGSLYSGRWNFNGGSSKRELAALLRYSAFEDLARRLVPLDAGQYRVVVVNNGGTFDLYDFRPGGQGEDNDDTLVVFNTSDMITITATTDGRQFGPTGHDHIGHNYVYRP